MSLFEWLFESPNPRPDESMGPQTSRTKNQPPILIILYLLLAISALGIPFYLANFPTNWQQNWGLYLGIWSGEIIYLILGFFVQPEPDTEDMGWFGGLINNPFRITDNFNRFLLFLKLLLLPGRLVAQAIMNFINLIANSQH